METKIKMLERDIKQVDLNNFIFNAQRLLDKNTIFNNERVEWAMDDPIAIEFANELEDAVAYLKTILKIIWEKGD